jgi:hypothetical protein
LAGAAMAGSAHTAKPAASAVTIPNLIGKPQAPNARKHSRKIAAA